MIRMTPQLIEFEGNSSLFDLRNKQWTMYTQESERIIRVNKTVTAAFTSISILSHDCRLLRFTWYQQMFPLIDLKWIKWLKSTNTNYNLIIMNETLTLAFILIIDSDNIYFYISKTTRGALENSQQTILPIGEVRDKLSEIYRVEISMVK